MNYNKPTFVLTCFLLAFGQQYDSRTLHAAPVRSPDPECINPTNRVVDRAPGSIDKACPAEESAARSVVSSEPVPTRSESNEALERRVSVNTRATNTLGVVRTSIRVFPHPNELDTTEGFDTKVSEKEIESSAGTFGDPSRFMQLLPGVVSDNDQYNDFIVRGGNPDENLFIVDNIEVPSINQLALSDTTGGFVSMIDNAAIQQMTLHTDAYDSKYDQRLSSVVEFSTRPEGMTAPHSESEIGIAGAGGSTSLPWGQGGSLFVSARRSILNLFTNDIGMNGVPIYNNALIRADNHIGDNDRWWGLSLTGIDSINIHPSPTDAWETNPYDIRYQGWRNTTGLNWQHVSSARSFGVLSFSNSQQSQSILQDAQLLNDATVYSENSSDGITVLKYDETVQAKPWLTITAGGRSAIDRINYNVQQPLGLQNPYSENPALMDAMSLNRKFTAFSSAEYSQIAVLLPHGMEVVAGQRLSQWAIVGSTVWTPKILFITHIFNKAIHFGYSEYAQLPPSLYILSFANQQALKPIRSEQLTAGVDIMHSRHIEAAVEVYRKHYLDYPVAVNYPQVSLANVADTFGQTFLIFPMVSKGSGLAQGAELSLHYRLLSRLSLTSAVTYSRSWYSGLDGILRRGNYDLPLVANVAGTLSFTRRSSFSFRYSGATGKPYTPDNLALSDAQDRDVYDLSMINAVRAPAYRRLDFRFEQGRPFLRGLFIWHVGLENALGTSNFYSYQWRPRAGDDGVLAQDQMPRFPDGGIKYSF